MLALTTVALASGGGGHEVDSGVLLKDFLWRCLNFGVTFALLAYFITKPLRKGLADRSANIAKTLEEAETLKRNAEAKFAEYEAKLSQATEEIDQIYQDIRREGEQERERILENANAMAKQVRDEAEKSAANEVAKARIALREEATRAAIEIAENLLREKFTADDQSRLVEEYVQKVGELH
ncbi:MAG: ATPase [Desulfuromonas sp.]|nr:MAG: ATPase [Desulfuromonas sp.]